MAEKTGTNRALLAGGAGAVLGAAAAIAALIALGWSAPTSDPSTLTLPETADGMRPESVVVQELSDQPRPGWDEARDETAQALSQSRGGVAVSAQSYADDELDRRVSVFAVADESPSLWSPQDSEKLAEQMGLALPVEWVERDGEVECVVTATQMVPAGEDPADAELHVEMCQLVDDGVTLLLHSSSMTTTSESADLLRDVAAHLERG